jgi:ABC-type multidrug transport system fused ATPase/permease subunit
MILPWKNYLETNEVSFVTPDGVKYIGYPNSKLYILKISNCKNFIENLPNGINTCVGERGNMLSGGQKQRVALARALSIFPEILILDEATSSLDYDSSVLIRTSLQSLNKKMTILIISHEIDFFESVDKVLILKNTKIEIE